MKTPQLFLLAVVTFASPVLAQTPVTPANPTDFQKRDISGGSSSGVGIVSGQQAPAKTVTVHFTAVTPLRVWTNTEGKAMMARLLAYSAPEEGKTGPVAVIREGKVRFLLEKTTKPIDYELEKLSDTDRSYIQKLADAARHEDPKDVKTTTEPVEEK